MTNTRIAPMMVIGSAKLCRVILRGPASFRRNVVEGTLSSPKVPSSAASESPAP